MHYDAFLSLQIIRRFFGKALQHSPVASDLAVDDALGGVVDYGGLSLNNSCGVGNSNNRLGKDRIGIGRLALDHNRLGTRR